MNTPQRSRSRPVLLAVALCIAVVPAAVAGCTPTQSSLPPLGASGAAPSGTPPAVATNVVTTTVGAAAATAPAGGRRADHATAVALHGGTATPGALPDLAITATALGLRLGVTQPPPPPLTGGGDPGAAAYELQPVAGIVPDEPWRVPSAPGNTESYGLIEDNSFQSVDEQPLSTFSIDVDTAAYSNVRRFLTEGGSLPPPDAVRIEELVNYFPYDLPAPRSGEPFVVSLDSMACPWTPEHRLLRIGLKGREIEVDRRPPANLVFLLDVSGSMGEPSKLPLVQESMRMLTGQLRPDDRVAIVVYAGASGLVLPSTPGADRERILSAIDALQSGGSTNGGEGIQLAYATAAEGMVLGGINRVILATDGDFNVGVTDQGELVRLIREKAKSGVFLTALGFGMGNLKDSTLESLADEGNGNYAYIDRADEARKVLVEQLSGTLLTIAKDVKIQLEFNPAVVAAYRQIGYENRQLQARDFADDTKDAGEIGSGHTVTALYEIVERTDPLALFTAEPLRYQQARDLTAEAASGEMLTVRLRYKDPDGQASYVVEAPYVEGHDPRVPESPDLRFAAAVAAFGMLLRDSPYRGEATWDMVAGLAADGTGADPGGYRAEFATLVRSAAALSGAGPTS